MNILKSIILLEQNMLEFFSHLHVATVKCDSGCARIDGEVMRLARQDKEKIPQT